MVGWFSGKNLEAEIEAVFSAVQPISSLTEGIYAAQLLILLGIRMIPVLASTKLQSHREHYVTQFMNERV